MTGDGLAFMEEGRDIDRGPNTTSSDTPRQKYNEFHDTPTSRSGIRVTAQIPPSSECGQALIHPGGGRKYDRVRSVATHILWKHPTPDESPLN